MKSVLHTLWLFTICAGCFFSSNANGALNGHISKTANVLNPRPCVHIALHTFLPTNLKTYTSIYTLVADERWKVYNNVAIQVAMLQDVQANEGSDRVAVVDYAKMWLLTGAFLAAGDQVRWRFRLWRTKTQTRGR